MEEKVKVKKISSLDHAIALILPRPESFDDIQIGDSICCNGVCLTLETFDEGSMGFTLGYETLNITGWDSNRLESMIFNLERSLKFGDRIHGHLVSGHVDAMVEVLSVQSVGESLIIDFSLPQKHEFELWEKSSITVQGVSLTVNQKNDKKFQVCLVPETIRSTNLQNVKIGQWVTLETDYYMKGLLSAKGRGYEPQL